MKNKRVQEKGQANENKEMEKKMKKKTVIKRITKSADVNE
jgi:hypothetical protein